MKTSKNYFTEEQIASYEHVIHELKDGTLVVWNKHVTTESLWIETYIPTTKKGIDVLLYNGKRYARLAIYSGMLDEKTTIGGGMGDIYLMHLINQCGLMPEVRKHLSKGKQKDKARAKAAQALPKAKSVSVNTPTNDRIDVEIADRKF